MDRCRPGLLRHLVRTLLLEVTVFSSGSPAITTVAAPPSQSDCIRASGSCPTSGHGGSLLQVSSRSSSTKAVHAKTVQDDSWLFGAEARAERDSTLVEEALEAVEADDSPIPDETKGNGLQSTIGLTEDNSIDAVWNTTPTQEEAKEKKVNMEQNEGREPAGYWGPYPDEDSSSEGIEPIDSVASNTPSLPPPSPPPPSPPPPSPPPSSPPMSSPSSEGREPIDSVPSNNVPSEGREPIDMSSDQNRSNWSNGSASKPSQCTPMCRWSCTSPVCEEECEPRCKSPKCETRCATVELKGCEVDCEKPECCTVCPKHHCPRSDGRCPSCYTKCSAPLCRLRCPQTQNCTSICESPQCKWHCRKPKSCPAPECELQCDQPAKECNKAFHKKLPHLKEGEIKVASFVPPQSLLQLSPAQVTAAGQGSQKTEVLHLPIHVESVNSETSRLSHRILELPLLAS